MGYNPSITTAERNKNAGTIITPKASSPYVITHPVEYYSHIIDARYRANDAMRGKKRMQVQMTNRDLRVPRESLIVILPMVVTILSLMPFKFIFSFSFTNVSPVNLFIFIKLISLPVSKRRFAVFVLKLVLRYGRYLVDRTDAVPVRYLTVSRPVCIITLIPLLAITANTIVSYFIAITTSYWCRIIVKIIIGILSCVIISRLRIVISISTCNLCDITTTIASDMISSAANITSGIVLLSPIIIIATETDFVYSDRGYNFAYNQSFSRLDCFPDSYLTNDFRYYFYFRPDLFYSPICIASSNVSGFLALNIVCKSICNPFI
ncbi:hypothetical protein AGLY_014044 [Aphis glycines]|uniref:Uncharacterized protein n=1 Tax=Aphis glycines TaxID=307491 RepID=A0A6G0T5U8_APHGL|nr:hypothetical protein AGLY_014044 [Aphis glycines]